MRRIGSFLVLATALALTMVLTPTLALGAGNGDCFACHTAGPAQATVDFHVGAVDLSKCSGCHWYAAHDFDEVHLGPGYTEYMSQQCTSCHHSSYNFPTRPQILGWPTVNTTGGWFQSATSLLQSPETLHSIHANGSWLKGIGECDSCHGAAACSACHSDPAPSHRDHGSLGVRELPKTYSIGKKYGDATADTYLYQSSPSGNYDSASTLYVGKTGTGEERFLVRFPISQLVGANVSAATLRLTRSSGPSFPMRAYRLRRTDWVENQASWNNYKTGTAWGTAGAKSSALDYYADIYAESSTGSFDVTALARAALAAGKTTLDLVVVDPAPVLRRYAGFYSANGTYADWYPWLKIDGTQPVNMYAYGPVAGTEPGNPTMPDYVTTTRTCVAAACHSLAKAGTAEFVPTCASCHPDRTVAHGYEAATHTGSPTSASIPISGVSYGPFPCSDCHSIELGAEHAKSTSSGSARGCAQCHPSPRNSFTAWDKSTCAQGGCHTVGSSAPMHGNIDAAHQPTDPASDSCFATGCHTGGDNVAAIHANASTTVSGSTLTSCQICHAAGRTATANCTASGCHATLDGHGDMTTIHTSNMSAAWMTMFDASAQHSTQTLGAVNTYATCSMCHPSKNLLDIHANDCSICHFGPSKPRHSFTAWNKSCQQGDCHVTYHGGASPAHDNIYATDGCSCHDQIDYGSWDGVATSTFCGSCHTVGDDATPPVSSANALASYVGTASITISATDDRAVRTSYYRLDGGGQTAVSGPVLVPPPAVGSQTHTLEYWSVDWSGNTESPKSATFTVTKDITPPNTTSDAKTSYAGPVTVLLTATDNATKFGVRTTYYRVDSGVTREGTTISVPEPPGGTVSHTIYFWSVDYAGNTESTKQATFSQSRDTVAPSTTTGLLPLPKYYNISELGSAGSLDAYFFPVDPSPSSGIAGIRVTSSNAALGFANGSEAWWNPVAPGWQMTISGFSGDGNYPISYAARDKSGNVEAAKTTVITLDITRPVTSTNAIPAYVGAATILLTPTDGTSGVASTSWRDGSTGAWRNGTTATIPAPTSGTVTHRLYFYSVDNARNQEAMKSVTFTVSAP